MTHTTYDKWQEDRMVRSKATGQTFEVLKVEDIHNMPILRLYHLRPVAPIVNRAYADRYKIFGSVCLSNDEVEAI